MFIIDTDVMSNLRKARKHPGVQAWIEATGWESLSTTVVTVAEIQCGIERQMRSDAVYASVSQRWLDRMLEIGGPRVYPLSVRAALLLARLYETPALRNFVVPNPRQARAKTPADLAIASIALAENATVATGNHKHFEEIDASVALPGIYNPFLDRWSPGHVRPGI